MFANEEQHLSAFHLRSYSFKSQKTLGSQHRRSLCVAAKTWADSDTHLHLAQFAFPGACSSNLVGLLCIAKERRNLEGCHFKIWKFYGRKKLGKMQKLFRCKWKKRILCRQQIRGNRSTAETFFFLHFEETWQIVTFTQWPWCSLCTHGQMVLLSAH